MRVVSKRCALSVRREINWPSCADPSPLAALLVAHIPPVCSLLAPSERGASTQEGDQFISLRTLKHALRGAFLALLALSACSSGSGDPLTRSCGGDAIDNCLPFEYSIVQSASIEPAAIDVGDLSARAQVHIQLETCGSDAPGTLVVTVTAIADTTDPLGDGGTVGSRFPLLELRDDGTNGDAVAGDDVIDVNTPNPFDNRLLPANTDLVLRFEPHRTASCSGGSCTGGTCTGEFFDLPYRTGALAPPPGTTTP